MSAGKQALFDAKKNQLVNDLDDILAKLDDEDAAIPLTRAKQAAYNQRVEEAKLVLSKELGDHINYMITMDPAKANVYASQLVSAQAECKEKITNIVSKVPGLRVSGNATSTPNNSFLFNVDPSGSNDRSRTKKSYKYRPPEIPKFDGDIAKFLRFHDEWQEIQEGEEDSWILRVLDEKTPGSDDLMDHDSNTSFTTWPTD